MPDYDEGFCMPSGCLIDIKRRGELLQRFGVLSLGPSHVA
jgi:hypothetical protein